MRACAVVCYYFHYGPMAPDSADWPSAECHSINWRGDRCTAPTPNGVIDIVRCVSLDQANRIHLHCFAANLSFIAFII